MMDKNELMAFSTMITEAFKETESVNPDEIDFSWWDDDALLNFAFDYDKVKLLNEDDHDALIYALARRLDDVLGQPDI